MFDQPCSYLIPLIDANAADRFIERIGIKGKFNRNLRDLSIFLYYFKGDLPKSFLHLKNQFSDYFKVEHSNKLGNRLILVCPWHYFGNVFEQSKTIECQVAFDEFNKCLHPPEGKMKIREQEWNSDKPRIMGILNITPDSFYDGGQHLKEDDYIAAAVKMVESGVDIIDIGGESTRPGSKSVDTNEEICRILPPLQKIRRRFDIPISIDTVKPEVASAALQAGADMINDVSGLAAGTEMISVVKNHKACYCLMHTQGRPENMQKNPEYVDVLAEVSSFFLKKMKLCQQNGLPIDQITIDPGIGFGKLLDHNLDLLRHIGIFKKLGSLILQGSSNKSFIGTMLDRKVDNRLFGTLSTQAIGFVKGATIFRVHEVQENNDVLKIAKGYQS